MTSSLPLSDSEKQWLNHLERKLTELDGQRAHDTVFIDPRQLELAEGLLRRMPQYGYLVFGGYPGAERNLLHIYPAQQQGRLPVPAALEIAWSGQDEPLSHRDLLGAVLALGLRRDQIGDIVMTADQRALIFVEQSKADYISLNLTQVGRHHVRIAPGEPEQLEAARDDGREIKGTVASMRLDALLSLGFGLSRSRVVLLVKGGLVRINWRSVSSPALQLKEGDQISLKGRGRLVVEEVEGETRKGRIRLKLKKYS